MRLLRSALKMTVAMLAVFPIATLISFHSPYDDFHSIRSDATHLQILDRNGQPLTVSFQNRWNYYDSLPIHEMPELLPQAFVVAEDKRFYDHTGVDWRARGNALWQRLRYGNHSRGASTLSEQVVRMLHPRPRNYWSKWIEGLEALALESKAGKTDILEFYLNQVPYAANRRGVVQAARYYFNRDLDTLNNKEMLALVVLVRAPSRFDLYRATVSIEDSIARLAKTLGERKLLDAKSIARMKEQKLILTAGKQPVPAFHFADYVRKNAQSAGIAALETKIRTTLDSGLQEFVSELVEKRLEALEPKHAGHTAVLVADHRTKEILAWVSVGLNCRKSANQARGCQIDMVNVPRQPGSALKPFLYAAALEKGWTPATIIDDSPYSDTIGAGIHHFHNYSNTYYGKVTLREALGNSLNIPALHAVNYVVPEHYLRILHKLDFASLAQPADFYDDGLALGNGEVTLLELVQGYSALANRGEFSPLRLTFNHDAHAGNLRVFSEEAASLIGNILSDPWARSLEFGRSSVLNLPTQTAAKTGTSTDYRDAWAVGYDSRYVVGIWMGNTDLSPMDGITGSIGPALVLRGIFNELTRGEETAPLYLSPKLVSRDICIRADELETGKEGCATYTEYFMARPQEKSGFAKVKPRRFELLRPANGLQMAVDPRIPADKQAFEMRVGGVGEDGEIEWVMDGEPIGRGTENKLLWPVKKGKHRVQALLWRDEKIAAQSDAHVFYVK